VRNGPKWSKTLMLVMYDDWGGTYDHVVPPTEGVPDDEAPCNVPKEPNSDVSCSGFDFKRLGLRSTAMVISPWVKKASIVQEPQNGPFNTSQWEHSSASVRPINCPRL
jgi:phospholipase C